MAGKMRYAGQNRVMLEEKTTHTFDLGSVRRKKTTVAAITWLVGGKKRNTTTL